MSPSLSPVYWSIASRSAVSDSEVILKPTRRDCLYFKLLLSGAPPLASSDRETPWYFLAWTTTPFTVPANRALAVSPSGRYAILRASLLGSPPAGCGASSRAEGENEIWVVGEKCVPSLLEALQASGASWQVEHITTLSGHRLGALRWV